MTSPEVAARALYWFFVYGILGWCVEVIYAAIREHRLVNRGFLCGPICPIYGFGMVGLLHCMGRLPHGDGAPGVLTVFLVGMVLTTAIELIGGWALFRLYHIRWWDYSHLKGNLGGYICPQFSLLWGLGSVIMIKVVHPLLARGSDALPFRVLLPLDCVLLVFFAVDLGASAAAAAGLNRRLREIDELRARLRISSDKLTQLLGTGAMTADTLLDEQKLQLALAKAGEPGERRRPAHRTDRPRRGPARQAAGHRSGPAGYPASAARLPPDAECPLCRDAGGHPPGAGPPAAAGPQRTGCSPGSGRPAAAAEPLIAQKRLVHAWTRRFIMPFCGRRRSAAPARRPGCRPPR